MLLIIKQLHPQPCCLTTRNGIPGFTIDSANVHSYRHNSQQRG